MGGSTDLKILHDASQEWVNCEQGWRYQYIIHKFVGSYTSPYAWDTNISHRLTTCTFFWIDMSAVCVSVCVAICWYVHVPIALSWPYSHEHPGILNHQQHDYFLYSLFRLWTVTIQLAWPFGWIGQTLARDSWVYYQPRFKTQWGCWCRDVTEQRNFKVSHYWPFVRESTGKWFGLRTKGWKFGRNTYFLYKFHWHVFLRTQLAIRYSGISLGTPANERHCYNVTMSLIGWAHT